MDWQDDRRSVDLMRAYHRPTEAVRVQVSSFADGFGFFFGKDSMEASR
jgi:hypothetical protein